MRLALLALLLIPAPAFAFEELFRSLIGGAQISVSPPPQPMLSCKITRTRRGYMGRELLGGSGLGFLPAADGSLVASGRLGDFGDRRLMAAVTIKADRSELHVEGRWLALPGGEPKGVSRRALRPKTLEQHRFYHNIPTDDPEGYAGVDLECWITGTQ